MNKESFLVKEKVLVFPGGKENDIPAVYTYIQYMQVEGAPEVHMGANK